MLRRRRRRTGMMMGGGMPWILRDEFSYALAAGAVDGTYATDGRSVRTVVDTESKLTLSGGNFVMAGGTAAPAWGDPGMYYAGGIARVAGRIFIAHFTTNGGAGGMLLGWRHDASTGSPGTASPVVKILGTVVLDILNVGVGCEIIANNTDYYFATIMRTTGYFYFVKGGAFTNWTLFYPSIAGNTATMYPVCTNYNNQITSKFIRVPQQLWLPSPLASDSFNRSDGAIGTTDGAGHTETNGGGGLAWTGTGATISGNAAINTPGLGSELATGNLVAGNWYLITATQTNYFYTACAVNATFIAGATTALDANNKVKLLTLATEFLTVPVVTTNFLVDCEVTVVTSQTQVGIVARMDSATTPANYIAAYFDISSTVSVIECVAGVSTSLLSASKAFTASDHLVLSLNGSAWRLYHTVAAGTGGALLGSGTTNITTGLLVGGFSTVAANKINSIVVWAKGNEDQYSTLDKYSKEGA